ASCSRKIAMTCSSVNRERFIVRTPLKAPDSTHFWMRFRGSGHCLGSYLSNSDNGITGFATFLLFIVTGGLVWLGIEQVRTSRKQLRAYIQPDAAVLCDGMGLTPPQPARKDIPGVAFTIKNGGQTPGLKVICWAKIDVIEPANEGNLKAPQLQDQFTFTLGPGVISPKAMWFDRSLGATEIADIMAGQRAIYIYGRIEYQDIFKRPQWTDFRLYYIGKFPPPLGVSFSFCKKGNESS
ncbi:MAG: hypothetical protein ACT4OG_06970, partial [Alphaproteobacteria bacterium]